MEMLMRVALVAVAGLLAVGCVQPTPAATPLAPTSVNASFGKTWNAVVDILAERNIPVKTMDRTSGFVSAELSSVSADELGKLSSGCSGFLASIANGGDAPTGVARYNILVRGDSTASTVKVTARFVSSNGDCPSRNTFEGPFQGDVKSRAEAK